MAIDLGKIGMTLGDEYDVSKSYDILTVVSYLGNSYVSKINNNNLLPLNEEGWQMIAAKGDKGDTGAIGYVSIDPKPIKPTDPIPTVVGWYKPEISSEDNKTTDPINWGTLYTNAGGLRAKAGYDTLFNFDGTTWTKSESKFPDQAATGKVKVGDVKATSGDTVYKALDPVITTFFDKVGIPASPNLANPANNYPNQLVSTGTNVGIIGYSTGWNVILISGLSSTETYTISGWNSTRNEVAFFSGTMPSTLPQNYNTGLISSGSTASILGATKSGGKLTFSPPSGTTWMAINIANASEADSVFASFQFEVGTTSTPYQPYNPVDTEQLNLKEIFLPKAEMKEINKTGNTILIRSSHDSTRDLVRSIVLNGSNSGSSNLTSTKLISKSDSILAAGTIIHTINDTVPPPMQVYIKDSGYSNLGGNHGTPLLDATSTAHGKTSADLGSTWTDGTGWEYYLVDIIDINKLRIIPKPKIVNVNGINYDRIKVQPASPLVHVTGATNTSNITFTGSAYEYKPCINSTIVKLYIDDVEITSDGTYRGNIVKVVDTHNISDPTQPNLVFPYLPQNNGTMVKNTLIHTFYANGSYTAENIANWQKSHIANNQGIIQPQVITIGSYSDLRAYSMNLEAVGSADFKNGFSLAGTITTVIPTKTSYTDQTKAIQQMSQILFDSIGPKVGAGFGYNPLVGLGKSSELLQNSSIFELRNTKKYYPTAFTRDTNSNVLRGIGYMAYWDATINPKLSADYYIPYGNCDLYFLNIRTSMSKEKVYLSQELRLREFDIINSSSSIILHTLDSSTSEGLVITGNIGDWAILKFK